MFLTHLLIQCDISEDEKAFFEWHGHPVIHLGILGQLCSHWQATNNREKLII